MVPDSVSFLSWNLAMLARSAQAPPSWGSEHTELAVRELVLEVEPELVLLQELPRQVPFVETHDMIRANPETHQGNLAILISHDLLARCGRPEHRVVPGCAVLVTFGPEGSEPDDRNDGGRHGGSRGLGAQSGFTVANVHLAAGPGAAGERLEQLARIVEASPRPELAIIGDTNTRAAELDALADAGLAAPQPPMATWNSRRNRFNPSGPEFTAFFTRALVTAGLGVVAQRVLDEGVEAEGHRFHLSDHYPLAGTIVVAPPSAHG
ncbi:MAG: hypothetical protein OEV40_15450 [Acidimicrobiia bacterium]|nr:hypothetical protein [Acidimicrobiia bacterium]